MSDVHRWSAEVPEDPDQAATYWIARECLGLMSPSDADGLRAWLNEAAHAASYAQARRSYESMRSLASHPEVLALRTEALTMIPSLLPVAQTRWRQRLIPRLTTLVAVLSVVILGVVWFSGANERQLAPTSAWRMPPVAERAPLVPTPVVYSTAKGEQRTITLADGSSITLNTQTAVQVAYTEAHRGVMLLQGEALFKVAKNSLRPFVVDASTRRVTAVGTEFDIRLDRGRGRVRVALIEGRVRIDPVQPRGIAHFMPSLATERLDAGQEFVASEDGSTAVSSSDIERDLAWQNHRLVFRDDTLSSAVDEINRYSAAPIVLESRELESLRVSGVFRSDRPENFIAAVTEYYPIVATRSPAGGYVLRSRATVGSR